MAAKVIQNDVLDLSRYGRGVYTILWLDAAAPARSGSGYIIGGDWYEAAHLHMNPARDDAIAVVGAHDLKGKLVSVPAEAA